MNRDAIARTERRRQVTDELEFERDRATALREQLNMIVLELDGPGIDEEVFGKMPPEDVELIRGALQGGPAVDREGLEEEWLDATGDDAGNDAEGADERWAIELREGNEAEIVRLEEEIVVSNRRQEALERYLGALDASVSDFAAAWAGVEPAPQGSGTVALICVRLGDEVHECPDRAEVTIESGLEGDRWAVGDSPDPDAQITLMNLRVARLVAGDRQPLDAPGDNFLVDLDLSEDALPVGTRLRLGGALLEVSPAPHTGCKKFSARFGLDALKWITENRAQRLRGVNCRVLEAGPVAVGDAVSVEG